MGIGDDESLESSISVTVIATGFDPNQQQEIIHADPKKIIHNLDDNNEIVQNLHDKKQNKIPLQFDFSSDSIDFKNTDVSLDSIKENNSNVGNMDEDSTLIDSKININDIEVSYD